MKSILALLAAIFVLCSGSPSHAQVPMQTLGVSLGAFKPMSDFGDLAKMGFNFGVVSHRMLGPQFGVMGTADLNLTSGTDELNDFYRVFTSDPSAKYEFAVLSGTVDGIVIVPMEGTSTPFVKAGLGLYQFREKLKGDTFPTLTDSNVYWGLNIGAGVLVQTSEKMHVGMQAAFHFIPDRKLSINRNMLTLSANLLFDMGR